MMQRFWSWLAVNLGKHAGIVTVIGLVFTIVIGLGITQLQFATGQDSYLNKDSAVYKDNVAYQKLFGGEAMLTGISMSNGEKIDSIFTPEGIANMQAVEKRPARHQRRQGRHLAHHRTGLLGQPGQVARRQPVQLDRLQGLQRRHRGGDRGRRHGERRPPVPPT